MFGGRAKTEEFIIEIRETHSIGVCGWLPRKIAKGN